MRRLKDHGANSNVHQERDAGEASAYAYNAGYTLFQEQPALS